MKNIIDDGFNAHLVETAFFDGILEIPRLLKPDKIIVPSGLIPFTCRNRSVNCQDFVCFYEHDLKFADVLYSTSSYIDDFRRFPGIISPDCSLYLDMPLCVQIANIYMSRAVGHFFQNEGMYVIPNVRWGDERTYTKKVLPEKVAFLGIPKHSIVSVGTYGCIKGKDDKRYFREGLIAMLEELKPKVVLVYGSMPNSIFEGLYDYTNFIQYEDWISRMKAVH